MPAFVALLRGVNVGKGKRVPMAELRALLAGLGYTDVATLLNSGNAIFRARGGTPAKHAADIAAAISSRLDVDVPVIVKSADELAAIISESSLRVAAEEHSRYLVAFVQDAKALSSLKAIAPLVVPPDKFAVGKHAAYLLCAAGILESQAGKALLGKAGASATTRNWATVLKLRTLTERDTESKVSAQLPVESTRWQQTQASKPGTGDPQWPRRRRCRRRASLPAV